MTYIFTKDSRIVFSFSEMKQFRPHVKYSARDLIERGLVPEESTITKGPVDHWNRTLLHYAALVGSRSCAEQILRILGTEICDVLDDDHLTPADCAIICGHPEVLSVLPPSSVSSKGLEIAKWRLRILANPLHIFPGGDPKALVSTVPKTHAASLPHWDYEEDDTWTKAERGLLVPLLYDDTPGSYGLKGAWGKSPLHYACTMGHSDVVVMMLMLNKTSSGLRLDQFNWTPLHYAVKLGHTLCVEAYVKFSGHKIEDLVEVFQMPEEEDLKHKFLSMVAVIPARECDEDIKSCSADSFPSPDNVMLLTKITSNYCRNEDFALVGHILGLLPWSREHHHVLFEGSRRRVVSVFWTLRKNLNDDSVSEILTYLPMQERKN
eukprot:PhF_6_TR10623/c0_g1_i1/m.17187